VAGERLQLEALAESGAATRIHMVIGQRQPSGGGATGREDLGHLRVRVLGPWWCLDGVWGTRPRRGERRWGHRRAREACGNRRLRWCAMWQWGLEDRGGWW
jgi:hypothetical protein